jgi:hypothetical protein
VSAQAVQITERDGRWWFVSPYSGKERSAQTRAEAERLIETALRNAAWPAGWKR